MKFTANKKHLLAAFKKLKTICDAKTSLQALAAVKITVSDHSVQLTTTDIDNRLMLSLPAKVIASGEALINLRELTKSVDAFNGEITITFDDGSQKIEITDALPRTAQIATELHPDHFPVNQSLICGIKSRIQETIAVEHWNQLLQECKASISDDPARPHINSMLVERTKQALIGVTVDGHRLTYSEVKSKGTKEWDVLLQSATLFPLRALLDGEGVTEIVKTELLINISGTTQLVKATKKIKGVSVPFTLCAKLHDGDFPPYLQIIPKDYSDICTVDRTEVCTALEWLVKQDAEGICISPIRSNGEVTGLSFHIDEKVSYDVAVTAIKGDCPVTKIGVQANYLLDAVRSPSTDEVELSFGGALDPIKVTATPQYTAVVMPMRI